MILSKNLPRPLINFILLVSILSISSFGFKHAGIDPGKSDSVAIFLPDSIIGFAKELTGIKYRYGGTDKSGFDCSGFTCFVFKNHDIHLPRTSHDQSQAGEKVQPEDIKKADLLFFKGRNSNSKRIGHVGIAISDWGEDNVYFVHSSTKRGVRVDRLDNPYYKLRFMGASRLIEQKMLEFLINKLVPIPAMSQWDPPAAVIQIFRLP
jgi:hypothetical protein